VQELLFNHVLHSNHPRPVRRQARRSLSLPRQLFARLFHLRWDTRLKSHSPTRHLRPHTTLSTKDPNPLVSGVLPRVGPQCKAMAALWSIKSRQPRATSMLKTARATKGWRIKARQAATKNSIEAASLNPIRARLPLHLRSVARAEVTRQGNRKCACRWVVPRHLPKPAMNRPASRERLLD